MWKFWNRAGEEITGYDYCRGIDYICGYAVRTTTQQLTPQLSDPRRWKGRERTQEASVQLLRSRRHWTAAPRLRILNCFLWSCNYGDRFALDWKCCCPSARCCHPEQLEPATVLQFRRGFLHEAQGRSTPYAGIGRGNGGGRRPSCCWESNAGHFGGFGSGQRIAKSRRRRVVWCSRCLLGKE